MPCFGSAAREPARSQGRPSRLPAERFKAWVLRNLETVIATTINKGDSMSTSANPVTLPLVQYSPKHFLLSAADGVATVTLNRPERKNPLTFESYRELTDFFRACAFDDAVKTIVVTGAGGNFSSGGDVFEIIGPLVKMDTKGLTAFTRMTGDLVKAMRACPHPSIAAGAGIRAPPGAHPPGGPGVRPARNGGKRPVAFNTAGL